MKVFYKYKAFFLSRTFENGLKISKLNYQIVSYTNIIYQDDNDDLLSEPDKNLKFGNHVTEFDKNKNQMIIPLTLNSRTRVVS